MIEFDEEAFIEEYEIDQRHWRDYMRLRKLMIVIPRNKPRPVPGLEWQLEDFLKQAARGNVRRLMPGIVERAKHTENTIYSVLTGDEASPATLYDIENAISEYLFSERFDVPTTTPTTENLAEWLQRWVGTYNWLGEFLGVKANTIAAWLSRGPRDRLLAFAQRWLEARLALWPKNPNFNVEYVEYLEDREAWAAEALSRAADLARADCRTETAAWEPTPDGQLYLEDARQVGEERACDRAQGWSPASQRSRRLRR